MDIHKAYSFKDLHSNKSFFIAIGVVAAVGMVFIFYNLNSPAGANANHNKPPRLSGSASFLKSKADTTNFIKFGNINTAAPDTSGDSITYIPPPPDKLFRDGFFKHKPQNQPHRYAAIQGYRPQRRSGYVPPQPRRRNSSKENDLEKARKSNMMIGGKRPRNISARMGSDNPPAGSKYLREAEHRKNHVLLPPQRAGGGFNRAKGGQINSKLRRPQTKYTLLESTLIPATLLTPVNSELPGNIIAIIDRNVYDSIRLEYILIPKGTKVIGSYNNKIVVNQKKMLMSWDRLIFPDGRSMRLPALNTYDRKGASGLGGKVNSHFLQAFAQSAMLSIIGAATAVTTRPSGGGSIFRSNQSLSQIAARRVANQFNNIANKVLQRNLNRPPTIHIDQGTRFNIFLAGDISFKSPYKYSPPR
jgi:type IV secretory pathway VirB10-like protein